MCASIHGQLNPRMIVKARKMLGDKECKIAEELLGLLSVTEIQKRHTRPQRDGGRFHVTTNAEG